MKQGGRKYHKLLFLLNLFAQVAFSQAKSGLENYSYLSQGEPYSWMPVIHYESAKGHYLEFRYNYEAAGTYSVFNGYVLKGGEKLQFRTIPMIGVSAGSFEGFSLANNTELEWKKYYISVQSQYSISSRSTGSDFFFSWLELGYSASDNIFGGMSFQYTLHKNDGKFEPGIFAGLQVGKFSFPVYLFCPFSETNFWVVGANFNYDIKKTRKKQLLR